MIDLIYHYIRFSYDSMLAAEAREKYVKRIYAEGGRIRSFRRIGLYFFQSPFSNPNPRRYRYYEYTVRYPDREGRWHILFTVDAPEGEWVWKNASHFQNTPPNARPDAAVNNNIKPLGLFQTTFLFLTVTVIGIALFIRFAPY